MVYVTKVACSGFTQQQMKTIYTVKLKPLPGLFDMSAVFTADCKGMNQCECCERSLMWMIFIVTIACEFLLLQSKLFLKSVYIRQY